MNTELKACLQLKIRKWSFFKTKFYSFTLQVFLGFQRIGALLLNVLALLNTYYLVKKCSIYNLLLFNNYTTINKPWRRTPQALRSSSCSRCTWNTCRWVATETSGTRCCHGKLFRMATSLRLWIDKNRNFKL